MYKKVSPLPEELTLVLKYKNKNLKISFDEPSIFNIYKIEQLLKNKMYFEVLNLLNIDLEKKFFEKNPAWIISWIIKLIHEKKDDEINKIVSEEKENNDKFFLFWLFDRLANKYNKEPLELMQKYTPSQLVKIAEWISFNKNIDKEKEYKNDIYLDPGYIEQRNKEYEDTMKRVYEAKEKLGLS